MITTKKVAGSPKLAHQTICDDDVELGEVWREEVSVVVSRISAPRVMAKKLRWFARATKSTAVLGRGTRAAMILGPGFKSKTEALEALQRSVAGRSE